MPFFTLRSSLVVRHCAAQPRARHSSLVTARRSRAFVTRHSSLAKRPSFVLRTSSFVLALALLCAAPAIGQNVVQVGSWDGLAAALADPDASVVIQLSSDITRGNSTTALAVPSGRTATLDLCGHRLDGNGRGGGVLTVAGTLNLQDSSSPGSGKITGGNSTEDGGGVLVKDGGKLVMEGVNISGNAAAGDGGGAFVAAGGTFEMKGGVIGQNSATNGHGGGVYFAGAEFKLSGDSKIYENDADNLYLADGKIITLAGALAGGTRIGVTMETPGAFCAGGGDYPHFFFSDDGRYFVTVNGAGAAALASPVTYLDPVGGTNAYCTAYSTYDGQTTLDTGWWVVSGTKSCNTRIKVSGDVNLILADGCKLAATKGIQVAVEGSITNSLTIWAQSDATAEGNNAGKLVATAGDLKCAGIGGDGSNPNAGAVTVNGGKVDASCRASGGGSASGAGIGGGARGAGGTVTVNGGTVTASCSKSGSSGFAYGSGIGGGYGGAGGAATVNGGTVTAVAGQDA